MGLRDLIVREKAIQAFLNVYLGISTLYIVHGEKELNKGFADLVLEPFIMQYPAMKYSYIIEIKYIPSPEGKKKITRKKINEMKEEAETQLKKYSLDEKFKKAIAQTTLKKLVLIFVGHRLVYHDEAA
jgi:hypothetical protein